MSDGLQGTMSDHKKMIEYKGYVSIGLAGCKQEFEFEVEEGATEEEIFQEAKEWMMDLVEWNYSKK